MSAEDNLTPWFSVHTQPPVREGVYQVRIYGYGDNVYFSYWNGAKFGWVVHCTLMNAANEALLMREQNTAAIAVIWRGIVK